MRPSAETKYVSEVPAVAPISRCFVCTPQSDTRSASPPQPSMYSRSRCASVSFVFGDAGAAFAAALPFAFAFAFGAAVG